MNHVMYMELGFPILLVNPPMVEVWGELVPDINLKRLQADVFQLLIVKPTRFTGAEVRFIRTYLRLRQADLADVLNLKNHSVVSQWEGREDEATGMNYNNEVLLRVWMAAKVGKVAESAQLLELLEEKLKHLRAPSTPLEVEITVAA